LLFDFLYGFVHQAEAKGSADVWPELTQFHVLGSYSALRALTLKRDKCETNENTLL
jgi:hypothetical protein